MDINEELGPVNPNLIQPPIRSKERRSMNLVKRLTNLDDDHALEFVRLFEWHISRSPGGAEGLLKKK
jgi:hypothetical protein